MNSFQNAANVASSCLRYSVRSTICPLPKQPVHQSVRLTSTSNAEEVIKDSVALKKKIIIPERIERCSTDILKALSSTVKNDYTAPHFKYHDDPFLIPLSNLSKRAYALSQESGRKAARWIRQEHADLFQHKVADPPIEAFFPQAVYDKTSEVNETVLQKVIALHQVSDSLTVYGLLEEKGVELSRETLQSLLELLCYYNAQDTLEEEWIEERWFKLGQKSKGDRRSNIWKREGAADKLFKSLSPPDSASYAALICGKAQFGDIDGAYKLYQEASSASIGLPTEAFNKLIAGAHILKEGHELRWQFVEEMLGVMKQEGVSPNVGTLNSVLETISTMSVYRNSQENALKMLAEFRTLGIKPSPASYCFLLRIFCRDRHVSGNFAHSAVLINILDILGKTSLDLQDPRDVLFFTEAMDVCRFHLSDLDTAFRVDKLLNTANNYNLIGDSYKESVYYRNFFALICKMGSLEELMDMYNKLVPNIYVPEPGIMEEIIKVVELNEAWCLLPKIWSDMVMFDQANREASIVLVLSVLRNSRSSDTALNSALADIAWSVWQRLENQREDRMNKKITWTGEMLGDILLVLLRADNYDQAMEIVNSLDKRQQHILGVPLIESMASFLDKSINRKEIKNAIWCIQYCSDAGYEDTVRLAQRLDDSGKLNKAEHSKLVSIVGQGALRKQQVSN